ncbi:MAG: VanZ family protein [Steroidobacteraceae bacterium]
MLQDLRYGRIWLVLGWIAVTIALILNLMPGYELHGINLNDKLEHVMGYVLLTLWFCGIYPRARYWAIALAFLGMGVLVEILQGVMHWGRTADIHDVYADMVGIGVGLTLAALGLYRWPRWIEAVFRRK